MFPHCRQRRQMMKKMNKTVTVLLAAAAFFSCGHITASIIDRSKSEHTIACIGDSITWGAGVYSTRETEAWPVLLQNETDNTYTVQNYAFPGKTLLSTGDNPYSNMQLYKDSLHTKASVIMIMLGTNDSKPQNWNHDRYREELESFAKQYTELKQEPTVILMTCPAAYELPGSSYAVYDIDNDVIRDEIRPVIYEVAEKLGLPVIDIYTLTDGHPEWFSDGVHTNRDGNAAIASYVYQQLFEENESE